MKRLTLAIILSTLALPGWASADTYQIDPSHSQIGFKIRHLFSQVPGRFGTYSATIVYDEKNPGASSVKAEIQTTSINTDNAKRDEHLRSADFFDVQKFPTMTFESTRVKKVGKDKLAVVGNFTMKGITKLLTLDVAILGSGPDPFGGHRAGFTAKATINRKDFGMTYNQLLDKGGYMLGDDVSLEFEIEAIRAADAKK